VVAGSNPAGRAMFWLQWQVSKAFYRNSGGRSSVGRALDCDSSGRGFKPHRPPHFSIPCSYFIAEYVLFSEQQFAGVVELVDTLDLGSSASRRESSSLSFRTIKNMRLV
jgi:hypothetical protein